MMILLPRLPRPAADDALDRFLARSPDCWAGFDPDNLAEGARFAASGGSRADRNQLSEIRRAVLLLAEDCGFPAPGNRQQLADFDARASALFASIRELASGESLRDDVWAFLAIVVAPDIVHWRFGKARERYLGGVRNTFQRLWLRGCALDRGEGSPDRWGLLSSLTEDALVQITERPSIGGNLPLARQIAEAWVRASSEKGRAAMEPLMRSAVLRLRIWNEVRDLSLLSAEELRPVLDQAFEMPVPDQHPSAEGSHTPDPDSASPVPPADAPTLAPADLPASR